jgi:VanZ family protein
LVALVLVVLYSLSDELHQSFVPSRGASLHDCAIDSVGGLAALLVLAWAHSVRTGSGSDRIKTSH